MKNYLVEVKALIPYPKNKSYTLTCTSAPTAIGRAIRLYRKELGKKRLYSLTVKCDLLRGLKPSGVITPREEENITTDKIEALETKIEAKPTKEISFGMCY